MKNAAYYQAYLSHNQISRRRLLRSFFTVNEGRTTEEHISRPPFAAREDLFSAACNGCGKCVSVCPHRLIHLVKQQAILEIDYAPCHLCGKCAEVCPTHALHPNFSADTRLRPKFSSTCLIKQHQTCTDCQTACPQQAISPELIVNKECCNGCGECKIACFTSAITLK
ncbi:ferredoxin-type protein NapF [Rodentibacter trehalosifermentans]|uniref:Ferredoxin-type protein NapF n=1 Tax=Rodentibacter trehalosifermentans TaxID=1908263 RepID=A0A1V3INB1_9PAST|nr:ferredoxin-type protein NapF [Rodentibacter trehalosifermentans]OOF43335.1 ferredoxin-type protein NapF [Rodentibacter trehalosifermentans]OOF47539.1 ferredoxin-type protein NapF [Rodentibacter trehalosifermentans]